MRQYFSSLPYLLLLIVLTAFLRIICYGEGSAVNELKSFIAEPPPVSEFIYEELSAHATTISTTNTNVIRQITTSLWNSNMFFSREIRNLNELSGTNMLRPLGQVACQTATELWFYDPRGGLQVCSTYTNSNYSPSNAVQGLVRLSKLKVSQALNCGIPNSERGSVKWIDDTFTNVDRNGTIWRGRLLHTDSDKVTGLSITNIYHGVTNKFKLAYEYGTNPSLPRWMPEYCTLSFLSKSNTFVPTIRLRLLSLTIGNTKASTNMLEPLILSNTNVMYVSNATAFYMKQGKLMSRNIYAPPVLESTTDRAVVLFAASALGFVSTLFLVMKKGNDRVF